jgi:hypothetical protein
MFKTGKPWYVDIGTLEIVSDFVLRASDLTPGRITTALLICSGGFDF